MTERDEHKAARPQAADVEREDVVSHIEAREAASRLIASAFHREEEKRARFTIPARPDDDDLLIMRYIKQQALAAMPVTAPPEGWRDVASAPKDGTHILWCGDNGEFTKRRHTIAVIWWPEYEGCFETGWWMPLPAPPGSAAPSAPAAQDATETPHDR